ncbi:MAG: flagellar protein FlgN [Rhodoplanes sp.]|uniref:flagellar protein FlgN n=1 Tax=Rhodoplanes sp. TaxID=1968906 RepID=UPI00180FBCAB|nr:flagellar protein FlgN [Rhodoplanes sp.]NVO16630.1 flagellar protein FlgN [Rhodoplanes sp.]
MSTASIESGAPASSADMSVAKVTTLIDELIALVEQENRNLARGMPAKLSASTARKTALAEDIERWALHVQRHRLGETVGDVGLRERLVERIRTLNTVMDENVTRLRQAIAASQRRVDAIMRAIREDVTSRATYGRNGQVAGPRVASTLGGKGIQA